MRYVVAKHGSRSSPRPNIKYCPKNPSGRPGQAQKNPIIQKPPPHLRPGTAAGAVRRRPHVCCTLCAPLYATRAHWGRPPARTARAGGAAGACNVRARVPAPPCATRAHDYGPACATCAHHRAQHVRTVTGQRAQLVRTTVRRVTGHRARQAHNGRRDVRAGCAHDPMIPAAICAWRRQAVYIMHVYWLKTRRRFHGRNLLAGTVGTRFPTAATASTAGDDDDSGGGEERKEKYKLKSFWDTACRWLTTFVTSKPHFRTTHRIMVKRLATSPHDLLSIIDSACKNQSFMVSVQYGPFNTNIPIISTNIDSVGYPRTRASGESSINKYRLLHASGPHPTPPPGDPN
ncbi:hypothetical protein F511_12973 [Dorcoceras hygrometricum]|uniref:Uncharacterized protein n=1 Tax=Dorcoceras hygrometricum TaxID=472368 RepID=A0A2Z7BJ86_9LAMI|nr:hypothetical protein F511_12973 [Dorcoceras hygrometricum]